MATSLLKIEQAAGWVGGDRRVWLRRHRAWVSRTRVWREAMTDQGGGRAEQRTYLPRSEIVSISASTASRPPGTRTPRPRGTGACGRTFSTQSANTLSAVMKVSHSGKYVAI